MIRSINNLSFVTLLILLLGSGFPAYGSIIFSEDVEEPNIPLGEIGSPWRFSGNQRTEIVASPQKTGQSLHFVLNKSDPVPDRTELVLKAGPLPNSLLGNNFTIGEEYWIGFSIFLPADGYVYHDDDEIVFQFHGVADTDLGEPNLNPMFAVVVDRGRWQVLNRWDSKMLTPDRNSYEGSKRWTFDEYVTDKWTDWVLHIKWSYEADGILQIWKDGELMLDKPGPNTFNDAKGPYLKMGIYKYFWPGKTTQTDHRDLYYDDIRIGDSTSSYNEVAPNGSNTQPSPPPVPDTPVVPVAPATPSIIFTPQ